MLKSKKILLCISCFLLLGCGTNTNNNSKDTKSNTIPKLSLNSIKTPLKASYNIYEINFEGDAYLKIKLNKSSKFLYKNGGIEYSGKSEILYSNGQVTNYKSGDVLAPGEYILKIHSDTNLEKYHPYISFIANNLAYTKIYSLSLKDGKVYNVSPGFKGYFKIFIDNNKCLSIEGHYNDITLYDSNLSEIDYDLYNHVECNIPKGEYILYYNNYTIYSNEFQIYYKSY